MEKGANAWTVLTDDRGTVAGVVDWYLPGPGWEQLYYNTTGLCRSFKGAFLGGGENLRTDDPDYNLGRSGYVPFGYLGMYHDPFTGLYHTHFREYDAIHGRWLSEDPAGYADGLNLYQAYMGVNGTDPLGLAGRVPAGMEDIYEEYNKLHPGINQQQAMNDRIAEKCEEAAETTKELGEGLIAYQNPVIRYQIGWKYYAQGIANAANGLHKELFNIANTLSDMNNHTLACITGLETGFLDPVGYWADNAFAESEYNQLSINISGPAAVEVITFGASKLLEGAGGVNKVVKALDKAEDVTDTAGDVSGGIRRLPGHRSTRLIFEGKEVRAIRDISHVDESTLRFMKEKGIAAKDKFGNVIEIHHHKQRTDTFLIEMPTPNHKITNPRQHPFGNQKGMGLTPAERLEHNEWRVRYWQERAREELARRGLQ